MITIPDNVKRILKLVGSRGGVHWLVLETPGYSRFIEKGDRFSKSHALIISWAKEHNIEVVESRCTYC